MDTALRSAFRATDYRFDLPDGELLLNVDTHSSELAAWLRNKGAACAAIITAFNPQGRRQDDASNRASQDLLRLDLVAAGHVLLPGRNEDPAGHWPVEESFLVLGISLQASRSFAARYGQLAFLWIDGPGATPRLVETAESG